MSEIPGNVIRGDGADKIRKLRIAIKAALEGD